LRSTTEELETSKEEAQSINEELTTVNHELKEKIEESMRANSDLLNLMTSTNIATIFLDRELRIKRFTTRVEQIFNITAADIGRPLEHFTHRLEYPNLVDDAALVLRHLAPVEREVRAFENQAFMARFLPYRTIDDHIEGVVLNFIDITERKLAENYKFFLAAIVESSKDAILTVDFNGIITSWNKAAEMLYGYTSREAVGKPLTMLAIPEDFKEILANTEKIKHGELVEIYETVRVHKDGREMNLEIGLSPVRSVDDRIIGVATLARDISARKFSEEALRESEERFRLVVESATDYAIFTLDKDNKVTSWNPGAERIFGWTEAEILGKSGVILFTPEDREKGVPEQELNTARRTGRAEDERWHLRRDGSRFFASGVMQIMRDAVTDSFVKICRDQTVKLEAEQSAAEKEMLRRMVAALEDERRRIARDIHDHFGQQITALRLKLDMIEKAVGGNPELMELTENVQKTAAALDANVDFIAWELRPASLDDLGLRVALAQFVNEWSNHTGIPAEFHAAGLSKTRLDYEIETNLYRIAQEALNNIIKHAAAANVSVLLEKSRNKVSLIIEDDGIGFNPKNKANCKKGLGLVGMSERAKICGGKLEIESAKGKGTTVFVRIPLKK
jgi:two-component system, chemotaxis family, CheB/CheR fusion protein